MDIIRAIILGIVEGITVFLPISSTGHLILVNQWISFSEEFTKLFDVVIQLGAILAVVIYFWKRIYPFGKSITERKQILNLWQKAVIAVIPAILIGGTIGKIIEDHLFNPIVVMVMLLIGGVIFLIVEHYPKSVQFESVQQLPYKTAFLIGLFQCLAMIPGTSRSAATIIGAMLLGASRMLAVEFSFFLAVPTMMAASAYSLLKHGEMLSLSQFWLLSIGFVVSFIVAWVVIAGFMTYVSKNDFKIFGYYRILLAIVMMIFFGFLK